MPELWDAKRCAAFLNYPAPPPPSLDPHKDGVGLPDAQGIYFLWEGDEVVYVGKSAKGLSERVRLGRHYVLKPSYRISYITVEISDLVYAECFYIGVLRPRRNFAGYKSNYDEYRAWKDARAA